jgi:hypothetical protein
MKKIKKMKTSSKLILGTLFVAPFSIALLPSSNVEADEIKATVYKSPTCGCCGAHVDYLENNGFDVEVIETSNFMDIKDKHGLDNSMRSCHSTIAGRYIFEGHIPSDQIKRVLEEKPAISGLSVPGMPTGTPGMGGVKPDKVEVLALERGNSGGHYVYDTF